MKKIISILILTLIIASCGENQENSFDKTLESNNLKELKMAKSKIEAEQQAITEKINKLNQRIAEVDTTKKVFLITTFKTSSNVFKHYLELQGNVNTKQNLVVYPEYSGVLSNVYVKEGQRVTRGQKLASIDDGGMSQQLAQLEIQADLAKTTFERQERLWQQNIGSEIQYLQAKSNYEGQQKAVDQMRSQLAKTIVRAPFSGSIDDVITEQGSVVAPGAPLMRIVNLNNMYIESSVPESYITSIGVDKEVQIEFPVLGESYNGKVRQAGSFINPANRTYKIEVAVPNKNKTIKPNLTAKMKINDYTNEAAILIPQNIISEDAQGQQYIYVVNGINGNDEGIANRRIITTGQSQNDKVEVLSGLDVDEEIIQEGARTVKEGQTVKIIRSNKS